MASTPIQYDVIANTSQFTVGMGKASADIQKFANDSKSQSAKIGEAFQGLRSDAASTFNSLAQAGSLTNLDAMRGSVLGLARSFAEAIGPAGLFVTGLTAGLAAIAHQSAGVVRELNSINRLGRLIGETPRNTQVLLRTFERGGMGAEESQGAILRFESRIGELRSNPNAAIGAAFRQLGLNSETMANQNILGVFADVAEQLSRIENATDRAHLASELFGRSWRDLAPIMARGRAEIEQSRRDVERFGATQESLDEAARQAAEQRRLDDAGTSWGSIWQAVGGRGRNSLALNANAFNLAAQESLLNPTGPSGILRMEGNNGASSMGVQMSTFTNAIRRAAEEDASNRAWFDSVVAPIFGGNTPVSGDTNRAWLEGVLGVGAAPAATTAPTPVPVSAGTHQANEAFRTWEQTQRTVGMTARQIEIMRAEERGASADSLARLRYQDELLSRLEREHSVRQNITAQIARARDGELALQGMTVGSVEAARLVADIRTRSAPGSGNDAVTIGAGVAQAVAAGEANLQNQAEILAAMDLGNDLARQLIDAINSLQGIGEAPIR